MKKQYNKSALVTDGIWRKSLAVVRGLSSAGIKVGLGERTWMTAAFFSRYADYRYVYPSLEKNPDLFLDWLVSLVKSNKFDALITPEEETSLFVAQHSPEIAPYVGIPLADYETLKFVRDKSQLLEHAIKLGIPCPKMFLCNTAQDAERKVNELSFPMVLKPTISSGGQGIRYVFDKNTLSADAQIINQGYGSFLMQEYIPGTEYYGLSVIFNQRNQMRSAFVHKKIRQLPVTGGASTYAVSVKYPKLVEIAEALLTSINWYGAANIEFKIDQNDNIPKLMEVNPRLWGSLQLAVASGINIPHLLYQLALEGDINPNFEYKEGVKFRWFMYGDLVNFLTNLIKKKRIDLGNLKLLERNNCHATWSLLDPLPYFVGLPMALIDYMVSDEMERFR